MPSIFVFCIILIVVIVSIQYLTTFPRIFYDEASAIEVARNFQLFGILDVLTAPGQFSGFPYITGSSGFPVTLPLAAFFKIFGFGFAQARIYALLWLLIFLIIAWFFTKNFWNASYATAAIALIAGFASFHDSGRRVMGDIPGFALLLLALLLLLKKEKRFLAGIFFGLAVAAKPSVYLFIIPALILTYVIADWRRSFRNLIAIGVGAAGPIIFWIILQFPHPLALNTWQNVINFYQNAFGSSYSARASILNNIKNFVSETTLIYFMLLTIPTVAALKTKFAKKDLLVLFVAMYGILDLLYFLKSPGRIRYLLPLELFILFLLPGTVTWLIQKMQSRLTLFRKFPFRYLWLVAISGLSVLHLIQFIFFSNVIYKNTSHLEALKFLAQYQTEMIGVLNSPHIAAFLPPERKMHYIRETDQIIFGYNPLDLPREKLPELLVTPAGYEQNGLLSKAQLKQLGQYALVLDGKWKIYKLNP